VSEKIGKHKQIHDPAVCVFRFSRSPAARSAAAGASAWQAARCLL